MRYSGFKDGYQGLKVGNSMSTSKICRDCGAAEETSRGWRCHQCGGALQPPLRTFTPSFLDRMPDISRLIGPQRRIRRGLREKLIMPQWMRDFLCGLGWHTGTFDWERGSGTWECSQTRICLRCGKKSSRIQHVVEHWTPIGGWFFPKESGVCKLCKRWQTQGRGTD